MPRIEITSDLDCLEPAPIRVTIPSDITLPAGELHLREVGGTRVLPAQREGDSLVVLVSGLEAGEARAYQVAQGAPAGKVTLKDDGPHALSIHLPEGLFTTYNFKPDEARPYFHPVHGPGGKRVTRDYPMKNVAEEKAAGDQDHPHHRSFWTAFDEVNEVNNWAETQGHGFTRHKKFEDRKEGPTYAGFIAAAVWTSAEGKPVLDEVRGIRVYNAGPDRRLLDYEVRLTAAYEDVRYGDTKEGGILAWRIFHTMKEKEGGKLENSNGAAGEKDTWGKKAAWLDYSGPVDGQVLGIAMMDHPSNPNHPCRWHARAYGLVGSNPFSTAAFEQGPAETIYHQKKGETLRFRYRVLIHKGGAKAGGVEDAYHAWVQGPRARLKG